MLASRRDYPLQGTLCLARLAAPGILRRERMPLRPQRLPWDQPAATLRGYSCAVFIVEQHEIGQFTCQVINQLIEFRGP